LSAAATAAAAHHPAAIVIRPDASSKHSSSSSSSSSNSTTGLVTKTPAFFPLYGGPKRADLNVAAASVRFAPGQGFILTAQLAGRINAKPQTFDAQSYYVFGINRGSPNAITPFPSQPDVSFDATVAFSVLHGGISVGVRDLVRTDSTTVQFLPFKDIRVVGNKITATVPSNLLQIPDSGLPISQWTWKMVASTSLILTGTVNGGSVIASIIPTTSEAPVGVPNGFTG
jgi:hypothetical protein